MPSLDVQDLSAAQRPYGAWVAALLHALVRDEVAGRRPARLTEANHATWQRFKGRLQPHDFVQLLFEDAAIINPIPFDPNAMGEAFPTTQLPKLDQVVDKWLTALPTLADGSAAAAYILAQAKLLNVPSRMARAELHIIKPYHKVLELPGTGGQLAHHVLTTQTGLSLNANFTIACGSWQELTLAGIVALDVGEGQTEAISLVEPAALQDMQHPLRRREFDYVVGLAKEKGGAFDPHEQLAIWFPNAKLLLV